MKELLAVPVLCLLSACVPNDEPILPIVLEVPFSAALLDEMRCERRPNPAPILQDLLNAGKITRTGAINIDSVSCFPTVGAAMLKGLPIVAVCGYEENPDLWDRYDDLFTRGPGTAPLQRTSVQTTLSEAAALAWYERTFGAPDNTVMFREPWDFFDGVTEITCLDEWE